MLRVCFWALPLQLCSSQDPKPNQIPSRWPGLIVDLQDRTKYGPDQGGIGWVLNTDQNLWKTKRKSDQTFGGLENCATDCCATAWARHDYDGWQFSHDGSSQAQDMSVCLCGTKQLPLSHQDQGELQGEIQWFAESPDPVTVAGLCVGDFMKVNVKDFDSNTDPFLGSMQCQSLRSKCDEKGSKYSTFCDFDMNDDYKPIGSTTLADWCVTNGNYAYTDIDFEEKVKGCKDIHVEGTPFGKWSTYAFSNSNAPWDQSCDPRVGGPNALVLCWDCPRETRPRNYLANAFQDCKNDLHMTSGFQCLQKCLTMAYCKFVLIGANDDGNIVGTTQTLQPQFLYYVPGESQKSEVLHDNLKKLVESDPGNVKAVDNSCIDAECCRSTMFSMFPQDYFGNSVQMVAIVEFDNQKSSYFWGSTSLLPAPAKSIDVSIGTKKTTSLVKSSSLGVEVGSDDPFGTLCGDGHFKVIGRDINNPHGRLTMVGPDDPNAINFKMEGGAYFNEGDDYKRCMSFNSHIKDDAHNIGIMSESKASDNQDPVLQCHSHFPNNRTPDTHCFTDAQAPSGDQADYFTFNCPCYSAYLASHGGEPQVKPPEPDTVLAEQRNMYGLGPGCTPFVEVGYWGMTPISPNLYPDGKFQFAQHWQIVTPTATKPTIPPPSELTETAGETICWIYRLDAGKEKKKLQTPQQGGSTEDDITFTEHDSSNCYPGHGAHGIDEDEGSNLYHGSTKKCLEGCSNHDPPCTSITHGKNGECFRHTGVLDTGKCDVSDYYTTYPITNGKLDDAQPINCYAGHGVPDYSNDLDAFAGNPLGHTPEECKQICRDEANCTAVTTGKNNDCYRHTGEIVFPCVTDPWYTTWIKDDPDKKICDQCSDYFYTCAKSSNGVVRNDQCERVPNATYCTVPEGSGLKATYCAKYASSKYRDTPTRNVESLQLPFVEAQFV